MSIFECNHTIAAWHLQDLQGCSRAWWWRCNWQNTLLGVPPASPQSPWSSGFRILDCGRFRLSWRSLGHLRQVIFLTDGIVTTNVCIANNNRPFFAERSFLEVKQPWRRLLGSEKVARGGASRMTRRRVTRRRMTRRRRRTTPTTRRTRPRTDPSFFSVCPLLSVQLFS